MAKSDPANEAKSAARSAGKTQRRLADMAWTEVETWLKSKRATETDFGDWLDVHATTIFRWKKAGSVPRYVEIIVRGETFKSTGTLEVKNKLPPQRLSANLQKRFEVHQK
jgi:hypothetical protein